MFSASNDKPHVSILRNSLHSAWSRRAEEGSRITLPPEIAHAVQVVMGDQSAPNRQYLIAIASGTSCYPDTNPASLQIAAGVDRRGQAKDQVSALADFVSENGLSLKISQDPGVSNQFREPEITKQWVEARKRGAQWEAFLTIVEWLDGAGEDDSKRARSEDLLAVVCDELVRRALANTFVYPRFHSTAAVAMSLIEVFLHRVNDEPDAVEAVVTAAARVIAVQLASGVEVVRGDTNAPDQIDVLLRRHEGEVVSAIEVTKDPITRSKLEHEVLPAMQTHDVMTATVVCKPPSTGDASEVKAFIERTRIHLGQTIELRQIGDIEVWLTLPGLDPDTATNLVNEVGAELDRFSKDSTRSDWLETLREYVKDSMAVTSTTTD